jgi:hypothetical protein
MALKSLPHHLARCQFDELFGHAAHDLSSAKPPVIASVDLVSGKLT